MNVNDMTAQEAADWCAEQDGWVKHLTHWHPDNVDGMEAVRADCHSHPHPLTLDGAAAALPEGWRLVELSDNQTEYGVPKYPWTTTGRKEFGGRLPEQVKTFGPDELTARYRLAVACRMAAKEQA
jgi:hypothetical protein